MKLDWLDLLFYGMALWRFSHMVVEERGFLDIFLRFRRRIGIVHDDDGRPMLEIDSNWARLFRCIWCTSVFFGIFLVLAIYLFPEMMRWLALPFVLSGIAIYINARIK